ncbi:hypothetical protein [Prosthecobacter sp.]|uniref:hypothetical protein n=1 Tax=Prosthecobacter sp. TaxID=1965333 RepID=UPI003784AF0A
MTFQRAEIEQLGRKFPVEVPWFSLKDLVTEQVVWTRQGNWRIDDAHEFFVADDGWSIIRFHGTHTYSRLLAISPEGRDALTVGVGGFVRPYVTEPPIQGGKWELWIDDHVRHTTAGDMWTQNARFRYFSWSGKAYFVCRTEWARYLVIDLHEEVVVDESGEEALFEAIKAEDEKWALQIVQETRNYQGELQAALSARRDDETCEVSRHLAELWRNVFTALLIVRQYKIAATGKFLAELQSLSCFEFGRFIKVTPREKFGSAFIDLFRRCLHLAMLRVGVRPKGYALMIFNEVGDWPMSEPHLLHLPECVENREALLAALTPGMTPDEVAFEIGAPEYIRDNWHDEVTCPRSDDFDFECWDYDGLDQDQGAFSWALLWRKPKKALADQGGNHSASDSIVEHAEINSGEKECPHCDGKEAPAELVSINRFVWDEAYWMLREEDVPISVA